MPSGYEIGFFVLSLFIGAGLFMVLLQAGEAWGDKIRKAKDNQ